MDPEVAGSAKKKWAGNRPTSKESKRYITQLAQFVHSSFFGAVFMMATLPPCVSSCEGRNLTPGQQRFLPLAEMTGVVLPLSPCMHLCHPHRDEPKLLVICGHWLNDTLFSWPSLVFLQVQHGKFYNKNHKYTVRNCTGAKGGIHVANVKLVTFRSCDPRPH